MEVAVLPTWQQRQRAMEEFWRRRQEEIEATVNFSERAIPMARLKKVICAEIKGSMLMTFDMPAFLSKACELFVQELAIRAWLCAESHRRCIVLDSDIAEAIASTDSYHFLVDIILPKPTRKRPRPPADQPSTTYRHPHHQIPQLAPRINTIPPPPPTPTIFHRMPLSFPFLPQEASTGQTALAGPVGGLLNIPNIYLYMNMMSMTNDAAAACGAYGTVGDAGTSNAAAHQQGDLTLLPCPFNIPSFPYLHHSCPLPVANSNDPARRTANGYGDNDVAAAIGVDDGQQQPQPQPQQQQEKETSIDDHQNAVHESAGAETIAAAGGKGNKYNSIGIGEDGIEVFDEPLLDKFLEEIQIDEAGLLSPDTTSAGFLSFINTIPDMEEWINDPYLIDDVFSNPSTSSK